MMQGQDLEQKIGQILCNCGPENAQKIIVRAEIFDENDGGKYEFDYIDDNGELDWFSPDGRAVADLTDALVAYKLFFLDNHLTDGKPIWSKCEIIIDIPKGKIGINLQYGD